MKWVHFKFSLILNHISKIENIELQTCPANGVDRNYVFQLCAYGSTVVQKKSAVAAIRRFEMHPIEQDEQ